jgi:hypothetical protein
MPVGNIGDHHGPGPHGAAVAHAHRRQHGRADPDQREGANFRPTPQRRPRRQVGAIPDLTVVLDHGPGVDDRSRRQPGLGIDRRLRPDVNAPPDLGRGADPRGGVDDGDDAFALIQQQSQEPEK